MLLLDSIIGEGECDIDLKSTAAADIFVVLDLDAAADGVDVIVAAATGFGGAAAVDFLALITLLLLVLRMIFSLLLFLLVVLEEEEAEVAENSV